MNYRALGRSGIAVSEIGFGAWGIGGATEGLTSYGATDDAVSHAALQRALDAGITFFDTSSVYGYGRSETLIGQAFRHVRDRVVIATKAGFSAWDREPDFSPDAIMRSCEESLARLQTDHVDLIQLHNPSVATVARADVLAALDGLVQQGKARAWGLSMRSPAEVLAALEVLPKAAATPTAAAAAGPAAAPAAVQVNLNMLDVRAVESGLLDAAQKRGIGIIARTPLCFGFLSGTIRPDAAFPPGDHRLGWPRAQIAAWCDGAERVLAAVPKPPGTTATQAALRFCLSFPAVSAVIPGMLTPAEVDENAPASRLGPLPSAATEAVLALNRAQSFFVRG
jgi:aryl-alcohol dehydrogenase-like predicted oxidoreductase